MDAIDAIMTRRSTRKFTDEPIAKKDIEDILKAGMQAPSAYDEQPWQFIIITGNEAKKKIMKAHQYAQMLSSAPVAILVCCDTSKLQTEGYWEQDCAVCMENMFLAAHAKGLGAVYVGVYPREERMKAISAVFGIPEKVVPFALLPLGHPAEKKKAENRYEKARVHWEKW
jgi:nitroreductase